ncbi:MAG: PAS domain S-box protein [Elusimicrobia bacterium]|nr:PAS domain S-box protein [Elusimicrobiota bacterium]
MPGNDPAPNSRPSEEAFRLLVESIQDYAIFMLNQEGQVTTWNLGAERMKGYKAEEILGAHFSVFYTPQDVASGKPVRELKIAAETGRFEDEGWRLRKDGSKFWANVVMTALHGPKGVLYGFSKVTRDMTRKKLEEERFRVLVEAAPNAMIMVGKDGGIVLVNSQTEKLFGYPRKELLQQPIELLVPERFRGKHPDYRRSFFAAPQTRAMGAGRDLYGLLKDGREVPIEIGLNPIETPEGSFVLASIIDITERKRAEEFRTAKEALEAVTREMETFSYSCAHDLRAPLRKIAGFGAALEKDSLGKLSAQSQDYLQRIQNNVIQMDGIIEGLLKLSRVLQQEPRSESVDLSQLAKGIADELQKAQPARNAQFIIAPGLVTQGDPEFLQIILRNLLENAWKFTARHPRAKIEFGAAKRQAEVVYHVRDDGAGFDMAHADKLFGAFKRLHAPGDFPGAGIGLATVHRVIRRQGGRIWAEAQVERGATFYFTLGDGGPRAAKTR